MVSRYGFCVKTWLYCDSMLWWRAPVGPGMLHDTCVRHHWTSDTTEPVKFCIYEWFGVICVRTRVSLCMWPGNATWYMCGLNELVKFCIQKWVTCVRWRVSLCMWPGNDTYVKYDWTSHILHIWMSHSHVWEKTCVCETPCSDVVCLLGSSHRDRTLQ